jgi:hypothetical protein
VARRTSRSSSAASAVDDVFDLARASGDASEEHLLLPEAALRLLFHPLDR